MADSLHLLLGVLDDLRAVELKRFRLYLTSGELVGYPRIPQGRLESGDQTDIASKMVETYGRDNSLKICQDILTRINRLDLAARLRRVLTTNSEDQDRNPSGTGTPRRNVSDDSTISRVLTAYRARMRHRYECIFEGLEERKNKTLLNRIYTELYITEEEDFDGANAGHEVLKLEQAHKMTNVRERPISFGDIFKSDSRQRGRIRTVLTKGIAGIGKTMAVQKFTLDWAEGVSHQEVDFIFVLPFRGLNQVKDERYSLHGLLQHFHPELQGLEDPAVYTDTKVVFILDGLDESHLALDFHKSEAVSDVRKRTSVDILITNLIQENLLPSALVWITTRPAAAKQIPPLHVHKWTEVLGFNEHQQKEYITKKLGDQSQKVLAHIKTSKSLQALCQIPVFCWILSTVLPKILNSHQQQQLGQQVPVTLTEVFISFLVIQMSMKHQKYQGSSETSRQKLLEENKAMILRLARLAFQGLKTGTLLFEDSDLKTSGMEESEASLYAGVCTEVFVEESALFTKKVYSFVHLSVQEFLAALHIFYAFVSGNLLKDDSFIDWIPKQDLTEQYKLNVLLKVVMDMCLQNEKGHLDLLVRFLFGMSLESNQKLLLGILPRLVSRAEVEDQREEWRKVSKPTEYIRSRMDESHKDISNEKAMTLLRCLQELKDSSLQSDIQGFLSAEKVRDRSLSPAHCTALVDMILMSEDILEELDLTKYNTSFMGYGRLIPMVKCCRKAKLSACAMYADCVQAVSSVLKWADSPLCELDMSNNPRIDFKLLCSGLADPHCKLDKLWLSSCGLSSEDCGTLVTALQTGSLHLRELDLSHNDLQDCGVELLLQKLLKSPWRLSTLRLAGCGLTRKSCETVVTVLQSAAADLNDLDLGSNPLNDVGVMTLCTGLLHPHCKLKTLRLACCQLTKKSCETVATVLQSAAADLNDLDLGSNPLRDAGVTTLSAGLLHPNCKLKTLRLAECDLTEASCKTLAEAMRSASSPLRRLELPGNRLGDAGAKYLSETLKHSGCRLESLSLCWCLITERGCEYLASSLSSSQRCLTELDVRHNTLGRAEDKLLSVPRNHPQWPLKINVSSQDGVRKYACRLTLNPDTATSCLLLSEGNRRVENFFVKKRFSYPPHPERFEVCCAQLLCCEALRGRHYWEVTYTPCVLIGVAYKSMEKNVACPRHVVGQNNKSWSIWCSENEYIAKHNLEYTKIDIKPSPSRRIGVHLDWPSGVLSFYSVSSDTLTHLHTYKARFTEPLYPGFCVYWGGCVLSLCQVW